MIETAHGYPDVTANDITAARMAEMLLSPYYRSLKDAAFAASGEDGEIYTAWRQRAELRVSKLAVDIAKKTGDVMPVIWETQRDVAEHTLSGEPMGPFAGYFFAIRPNGRLAEIEPADDADNYLPPGEFDVVQTNSKILTLSQQIEEPIDFLGNALGVIANRKRMVGKQFVGPENYATALKFFADKSVQQQFDMKKDGPAVKKLVGQTLGGFLKVAEKDTPNVIEVTNILAAIRHLPPRSVDKSFTEGILKHAVARMNDFDVRTAHNLVGAMTKLDFSECADGAAMVLDLALRRGYGFERTGNLLSALTATSRLTGGVMAERAFHTLLTVRTSLELSADPEELKAINEKLKYIVKNITKNPHDSKEAKELAEFVLQRMSDIAAAKEADGENISSEDVEAAEHIIADYKEI
jgi:hypothetical protein